MKSVTLYFFCFDNINLGCKIGCEQLYKFALIDESYYIYNYKHIVVLNGAWYVGCVERDKKMF